MKIDDTVFFGGRCLFFSVEVFTSEMRLRVEFSSGAELNPVIVCNYLDYAENLEIKFIFG